MAGTSASVGPTISAPTLTAAEARFMDGIAMLAEQSLFHFAKYVLRQDRLVKRVHKPACDYCTSAVLERYGRPGNAIVSDWPEHGMTEDVEGDYPRRTTGRQKLYKLILWPRGLYKSTCLSRSLPLWLAATCDPNSSTMLVFETQPLANTAARVLADDMEGNARFRYLYGAWEQKDRWQTREKTYACRDKARARRDPSLVMTSAGASWTGLHPDFVVLDDLVSKDNIDSQDESEKVRLSHDAVFALDPKHVWTVGTRYGPTDLYGQIMDERGEDYGVFLRAARNPDGSLWCPEVQSDEFLATKERMLGRYLFYSQYYNLVVSRATRPLSGASIKYHKPDDAPRREEMVVMMWCDPAGARGTGDSAWAIPVIGLTRDENDDIHVWLLDHFKGRVTAAKAAEQFCEKWWTWRPDCAGVENTGFSQNFIDQTLRPMMRKERIPAMLHESRPGGVAKSTRVAGVENGVGVSMENGCFHAREDDRAFRTEVAMFPSGSYDLLDAIASALKEAYGGGASKRVWLPASHKQAAAKTTSADYDMLFEHGQRLLRANQLRAMGKSADDPDEVLREALRGIYSDQPARDFDRAEREGVCN